MPYPVRTEFDDRLENRNRLTSAFRLILAVPHLIIVGDGRFGLMAALAATSLVSWFAIVFTGKMPAGLWTFAAFVIGWQYRANAYVGLLCDEYPPFGDVAPPGAYPAHFAATDPPIERDRLTVFFRLFMVIPHIVILVFLAIAAFVVTVIAWFAILFAGAYPAGLYGYTTGVLAWGTRVTAYLYLLTDEYPPFSLDRDPVFGPPAAAAAAG